MASSETEIANRALMKLGERAISDLSEDSTAARAVAGAFALIRDAELAAHAWSFATTRVLLPASSNVPAYGFTRSFLLPGDYLRLLECARTRAPGAYAIEGRELLCDFAPPLPIRYVRRVEDVSTFDPLFVEALACRLAVELAERITQSSGKRELAQREYLAAVSTARRANAVVMASETLPPTTWLDAHLGLS